MPLPICYTRLAGPALVFPPSHFGRPPPRRLLPQPAAAYPSSSGAATSCSLPALPAPATMSHRPSSSTTSRASRSLHRGVTTGGSPYPPGKETGLPLMICPDCKQARIIELRVVKETPNKGRIFFKCPRNGVSVAAAPPICPDFPHFLGFHCLQLVLAGSKTVWVLQVHEGVSGCVG